MQMPLIDLPSPLDRTVGKAFFTELPATPGVYRMYGDEGQLLYIGKAKNLRTRLMSYRRVKLGKSSGKSLRLVHSVAKIEVEECESEEHALLQENELLRAHKPPFNVISVSPEKHFYFIVKLPDPALGFGLRPEDEGSERIAATLDFSATSEAQGAVFGAYKGLTLCHRAFLALRRVLWALTQPPSQDESFYYPLELIRKQKIAPYEFTVSKRHLHSLAGLLHGFTDCSAQRESELITEARSHLSRFVVDEFHRNWFVEDLETLSRFFTHGPVRNGLR